MISMTSQNLVAPRPLNLHCGFKTNPEARCSLRKVSSFEGNVANFSYAKSKNLRLSRCNAAPRSEGGEKAATSEDDAEGEDIYVGSGRYVKGDPKDYPDKEDIGFFLGATGGFAGGEQGLKDFVTKSQEQREKEKYDSVMAMTVSKPSAKATKMALPMLMPGMNAKVINPSNPFCGFTGIVQRVSDGKVSIIFEGGCWDKNLAFLVDDVEKSDAPPGSNPKSATLQPLIDALKAADPNPVES
ncbi:hypothetical protein CYMTET_47395 [Cymbomonas tetramitiformis]|uniref:Uncharacterized protein n=1 Tax=Cymbomonas tetramitiformis TaxID=36881 RepID=A0AAE0BU68_9CHLO|nr:hypothetical protein CYMTET_47395 [Cymbomonas tetramitiformis]